MIKRHPGTMMCAPLVILTLAGCTTTEQPAPPLTPPMPGISEDKARVVFCAKAQYSKRVNQSSWKLTVHRSQNCRTGNTPISTYRRANIISWSAYSPIRALSVQA